MHDENLTVCQTRIFCDDFLIIFFAFFTMRTQTEQLRQGIDNPAKSGALFHWIYLVTIHPPALKYPFEKAITKDTT